MCLRRLSLVQTGPEGPTVECFINMCQHVDADACVKVSDKLQAAGEECVTGEEGGLSYSVPTGNFGDVLAGYYAKCMGLPVDKLLVATNENDILHRYSQSPIKHLLFAVGLVEVTIKTKLAAGFGSPLFVGRL